jgi:hypothetical protein
LESFLKQKYENTNTLSFTEKRWSRPDDCFNKLKLKQYNIGVKLIRLGFPPEVFSSFSLILFPLKTLMACFVGRFLKKGHEIRFIVFGYAAVILHSIM